ncbi:MAG: PKD domain-containing protein, partial [Flavobacterium sp.]|nr:PKD domain-containing protein [Flavobacterium sp.]
MKQYLILLAGILFFSANANVTLPPGATISVNNTVICQGSGGTQVTFTGVNGVSPYTFNYTVNGNPQTITTTGTNNSINVTVNTANFGNVTYILTGITDSDDPPVTSNVSGSVTIQIKPRPDATLNGTGSGSIFNGTPVFRICSNEVSEFEFTNGSSTGSINDTYTINWGDSTPNYVSNAFTGLVTHTYQIGLWNLTYTITGNNGCSTTRSYIVFVGSNPAVSLGNPGNTDICISTPLTFPITGTNNNPPGTTYTVTFNDGSPPIVFNHPPPSSVTHTFLASSCGTTSSDGSNSYPNSFFANIVASNPCSISSVGVVPIYVSTPPLTDFAMADTVSCTNIATCFTNTSIGSENFGAGSSCDTTPAIIWTISPNTGYTLSSGSLGNDFGSTNQNIWTSGSQVICPVFTTPGIYTITLKAKNRCGQDIEVKTICIESPLTPQFTLSQTNGCTPFNVSATNTTSIVNSCEPPTYQWNVSYTAGNCGSGTPTWSFAGGTSATSANPNFNFVTPGTYSITLTTTNGCGSVTSPAQTVIVKQPPTATIAAIADFCGSAAISPTATITNCAPAGEVMTYAWSFPGGSPALATTANPGTVTYANPGNYTVSLTVTNSCGSSTTATESFTVNVAPAITNSNLSQTICSGNTTTAIPITSLPAGATYSWVPAATPGLTGFAPTGTAATIPAMTIINNGSAAGTVTYTITPTINGCSGPPVNYIITVNPAPSISVHPLPATVCQNAVMTPLTVSYTNGTGTPSYQWFSNNTPTNIGGTAVPGATLPSFTPPSTSVGVIYYYVTVSLPTGGCSNLTSNVAAITITAPVTISTQPTANQSICVG